MNKTQIKKIGFIVAVVLGTLFALKAGRNLPGVKEVSRAVM